MVYVWVVLLLARHVVTLRIVNHALLVLPFQQIIFVNVGLVHSIHKHQQDTAKVAHKTARLVMAMELV